MQEIDTLGRLFDAAQDTRLERKSEGLIVVREGLADLLGCKSGESWLRVAGLRWHVERNIKLCWTEIFVARKYADVRKHVTDQTAGIFTLLERHFGVTLTRLEQEISAVAIDDEACGRTGCRRREVRACSCCAAISIRPMNCIRSRSASIRPTASP